jgi:hypothetical protein
VVTVLVVLGVWLLWPAPAAPQARQYTEFTACLLTDDRGIAGPQAAPVWAGLQDASVATHAQAEFLPIEGEQTAENASLTLGTLVRWRCNLVFAVGNLPTAAVQSGAGRLPGIRFFVVGGSGNGGNITYLHGDARVSVRDAFAAAVTVQ